MILWHTCVLRRWARVFLFYWLASGDCWGKPTVLNCCGSHVQYSSSQRGCSRSQTHTWNRQAVFSDTPLRLVPLFHTMADLVQDEAWQSDWRKVHCTRHQSHALDRKHWSWINKLWHDHETSIYHNTINGHATPTLSFWSHFHDSLDWPCKAVRSVPSWPGRSIHPTARVINQFY